MLERQNNLPEPLEVSPVRPRPELAQPGSALLHITHLAPVLPERFKLRIDRVRDVHLKRSIRSGPEVYLLDAIGLEPFLDQFGEARAVSRDRVDCLDRHLARAAVIRVIDEQVSHNLVWVVREHGVLLELAYLAHHVAHQLPRVCQLAVYLVQEEDLPYAKDAGGRALLLATHGHQLLGRHLPALTPPPPVPLSEKH